jgi:hypothetical protein
MQEKGQCLGCKSASRKEVTILDGHIAKPDSMAASGEKPWCLVGLARVSEGSKLGIVLLQHPVHGLIFRRLNMISAFCLSNFLTILSKSRVGSDPLSDLRMIGAFAGPLKMPLLSLV